MKIIYYSNFDEENRISMNAYAQKLVHNQKIIHDKGEINLYKPKTDYLSNLILPNTLKMRFARYISYPNQIKKIPFHDISHICDHQYGHLYTHLNSKLKFITVHDLVPLVFRKKLKKNPILNKYSLSKLKYFTKVLAVSENTKKDILKFTDCPETKIEVIHNHIEDFFDNSPIDKNYVLNKFNIPVNKKKILITGSIFYKNHEVSYKVLENILKTNNNIVFIHIGGNNENNIPKNLSNKIIRIPFVEREEIPKIYKICDILFFPSIYEGFGMPLLEAMSCGIPVICSNESSIPEIIGEDALLSGCNNINKFTSDILDVLNNKELYIDMINKSLQRAKKFNIERFYKNINRIYENELEKIN